MAKENESKSKRRHIILGVVTGCIVVVAVVLTVTLVLTLGDDETGSLSVVATVNQGNLVGNVTPQAGMFFGIPFSQPPVGEFRWKNPRDPLKFSGSHYDATYIRPACIQSCSQPAAEYSCPQDGVDEDCLYLNIFVPNRLLVKVDGDDVIDGEHYVISEEYQQGDDNSLAVMFFLHGGNFIIGAGSATLYDGRYQADHGNVIAVTANYRLGPLGYLVQGSGPDAAVGNYGVHDIVKALEWIQENIRFFGGNPNKVTAYGQSAGAEAIGVLMTSPAVKDRGLFHQTIMQSNPYGLPFRDWDNALEFGGRFADVSRCDRNDMDCLRSLTTDEIMAAYRGSQGSIVGYEKIFLLFQEWGPVIDYDFLPEQPIDAVMRGEAMDVPSIIGGTVDEGMYFVSMVFKDPVGNLLYRAVVRVIAKNETAGVIEQYPPECADAINPEPGCDNRDLMNDVAGDFLFLCAKRACLQSMKSDTWFYIFNETWSFYELWEKPLCYDRVCHAAELPYVFNIGNLTTEDFTANEQVLANRMGWYWMNFAKYGNPNGDISKEKNSRLGEITDGDEVGAVFWPKFNDADGEGQYKAMQMTAEGDWVMNEPYKEQCAFWDEVDGYGDF